MSLFEEAIQALYGNFPVKFIHYPNSPAEYAAFAKHDDKGKITSVIVSNQPIYNEQTRKIETKIPYVPEGQLITKLTTSKDIQTQKIEVKK